MKNGFTLVELMVVVAVIGILAGVLTPTINGLTDKAKVAKIVQLYENLKTACLSHYNDTSRYAWEYDVNESPDPSYHHLSMRQSYAGWNGPYIERPLNYNDNPYRKDVDVAPGLWWNSYDLDRNGNAEVSGAGNELLITNVPEVVARLVDETLDGPGRGDWRSTGIMEYHGTNVFLLLCGGSR
jgi:general secretion pathway protein G